MLASKGLITTMESPMDAIRNFTSYEIPKKPSRAAMLINLSLADYEGLRINLPETKSVDFFCSVGVREFRVYELSDFGNDLISIKTDDSLVITPIEQVSFRIVLFDKKENEEPPRTIGFKQ